MKHRTRIAGIMVVLLSALLMVAAMSAIAFADEDPFPDPVNYIDEHGQEQTLQRSEFKVLGFDTGWFDPLEDGWYVAEVSGNLPTRVEVTGNAKIILVNGKNIKFDGGIHVPAGKSLSIYGQTVTDRDASGKLIAEGLRVDAGIGGNYSKDSEEAKCGTINIYGGNIEAQGGAGGAGIGGGNAYASGWTRNGGDGGTFTMVNGWLKATGGKNGAGIGGGHYGNSGDINISGGTIEARGGGGDDSWGFETNGAAGIGGGEGRHIEYYGNTGGCGGNITITGGTIRAYGREGGAGIGGGSYGNGSVDKTKWIKISGGNVYAEGHEGGAGIGGGIAPLNDWFSSGAGAQLKIDGNALVVAVGGSEAAGIGSTRTKIQGSGETIIEGDADVTAYGGDYAAGIGTGNEPTILASYDYWNKPYDIKIRGNATVTAYGGKEGAGIGSGNEGNDSAARKGELKISENAVVNATGGKYGAGIGGGDQQVNGKVTIEGGTVNAQGGYGAAGIGDGDDCPDDEANNSSGSIFIKGGVVNATGGEYGAGIGGADGSNFIAGPERGSDFGRIRITGGQVTARATKEAAGIGGGNYWWGHGGGNGCDVAIVLEDNRPDDYVLAISDDDSAPIGHGDSGDSDGSLTLRNWNGEYLSVRKMSTKVNSYADIIGQTPVPPSQRISSCQDDSNKSVLIKYCGASADSVKYTKIDDYQHQVECIYCSYSEKEDHDPYDPEHPEKCTKCGTGVELPIVFKEKEDHSQSRTINVKSGAVLEFPEADQNLVPTGKIFTGWKKSGSSPEEIKQPHDTYKPTTVDTWEAVYADKVTISFEPGLGSGEMPTIITAKGTKYHLPNNKFKEPASGDEFAGWKVKPDGQVYQPDDPYPNETTGVQSDVTFVAQWSHEHNMIHHAATDATCEADGNKEYWECRSCKHFFKNEAGTEEYADKGDIVIPATGHRWAEVVYTWTLDGKDEEQNDRYKVKAERICLNDPEHHKENEEKYATVASKTPATCSQEGSVKYEVTFSNKVFEAQKKTVTLDKTAHDWGEWKEGTTTDTRECSKCHATEERDHLHVHYLVEKAEEPATCTGSGTKKHWVCENHGEISGCGKWYADSAGNQEVTKDSWRIPPAGHKLGTPEEYGYKTPPTCDTPGNYKTIRRCTVSGCEYSTVSNPAVYTLPALGHAWNIEVIKPATCKDGGLQRQTCLTCGVVEEKKTPALGENHAWGEWVVTRPATTTEPGEQQHTCQICGVVELAQIAPVPDTNAPVVTTTAKSSSRSMLVKWNKVDGVKKYKVAYRKVGSSKWTYKKTKKNKYTVRGRRNGALYEFKVASITSYGDVWSNTCYRYFKGVNVKATAGEGSVKIKWKKVKGATGYQVQIANNKKMNGAQIIELDASARSYKAEGLSRGSRYYVKVRPLKDRNGIRYIGILSKARRVKIK